MLNNGAAGETQQQINKVLGFVVDKFGPLAIFCLITRTCASYGISHLKPAVAYVILTVVLLLLVLFFGYALLVRVTTGLSPLPFVRKISKVALFGFSTSSEGAVVSKTRSAWTGSWT